MIPREDTVLIVDDSPAQRMALQGLLEMEGRLRCISLERGEDVVRTLQTDDGRIKACALDMTLLPGHFTGLETLRQLRSVNPTLPVLVFTGKDPSTAREAYAAGATLFMMKPYETHDLLAAINALILMHSMRQSVVATEGEIEILQTALDAMNVEVEIHDPDKSLVIVNASRKRRGTQSTNPGTTNAINSEWNEQVDGDRTFWVYQQEATSRTGRRLIVTTSTEVTRRKILDDVRQRLLELARKTPEDIFDYVAECLNIRFGYKRIRCYMGDATRMLGVISAGMHPDFVMRGREFPVENDYAKRVLTEKRPFLLTHDELCNDPLLCELEKQSIKSELQIPLVSAAGLAGVISVDDGDGEHPLTVEDADLMANLGSMVADAIQVARELQESQRTQAWLKGLNEIDRPLTEGGTLHEVIETLGKTLIGLIHADAGVVFTRRTPADRLRVISVINDPDPELWAITHDGHEMIGKCVTDQCLVFEPNVWVHKWFQECFENCAVPAWKRFLSTAVSVLVEPIRCGDQVIGVLFLRCRQQISLDEVEKKFLTIITNRVAIALRRLDEIQRIEMTLVQQSTLHNLTLLSAGVAHGMRNPLATIQYSLDCLRMELDRSQTVPDLRLLRTDVQHIQEATQRSLDTLARLIRWAKPHGWHAEPTSLDEIIRDLTDLILDDASNRRIKLMLQLDSDVPLVFAAPDPLRLALTDLFWNAFKAMPDGGELWVLLRTTSDRRWLELTIKDTGIGMTQEQLRNLFTTNPFEPVPPGGGGLGLYLCKRVLAAQKATIHATSELGCGTTVVLRFRPWDSNKGAANAINPYC